MRIESDVSDASAGRLSDNQSVADVGCRHHALRRSSLSRRPEGDAARPVAILWIICHVFLAVRHGDGFGTLRHSLVSGGAHAAAQGNYFALLETFVVLLPMSATIEQNILNALVELENAVKSMATANPKPNLLPLFSRIDELTGQLPRNADPQLLHYLHKKSYEKARLFLQDRDAENQIGNCRHV